MIRAAGVASPQAALPAQRAKFSKRQFTQPQLLTVLCLMRYEDGTFGETEVWFSEHSELRAGGGRTSHNPAAARTGGLVCSPARHEGVVELPESGPGFR